MVRPDVLVRKEGNRWELIEVKSSTSVQNVHLHDVAFQNYVLEKCGLEISDCSILHLNRKYVLDKEIDLKGIFERHELSSAKFLGKEEFSESGIEKLN